MNPQGRVHGLLFGLTQRRHWLLEPGQVEGVVVPTANQVNNSVRRLGTGEITARFGGSWAHCEIMTVSAIGLMSRRIVGDQAADGPGFALVKAQGTVEAANLLELSGRIGHRHIATEGGKKQWAFFKSFEHESLTSADRLKFACRVSPRYAHIVGDASWHLAVDSVSASECKEAAVG